MDEYMYVAASFESTIYLEMAITAIQMKGIEKYDILCIPLDKRSEQSKLVDSLHYSDNMATLELPIILAGIIGLFGSIYGFILSWGPIIWGLIGIFTGLVFGFIIKFFTSRKYGDRQRKRKATEVMVLVKCSKNNLDTVRNTLWDHHALGVGKLSLK